MDKIQAAVVVVIDMQKGFVNEQSKHVIPNVLTLISYCREYDIPAIYTRFHNSAGSPFDRLMGWRALIGSPQTDIIDELRDDASIVLDKSGYSGLTSELVRMIQNEGWQTVLLCGIATESCVLKTAVDLFEIGIRPIVVIDACASDLGGEEHRAGLLIIKTMIGERQLVNLSEILLQLNN